VIQHPRAEGPSAHTNDSNNGQLQNSALLTTNAAAHYLGISPATLSTWRVRRSDGPKFVKVGRSVRYRPFDLDFWLSCHIHSHTGQFTR